jgi:hypothetical protein
VVSALSLGLKSTCDRTIAKQQRLSSQRCIFFVCLKYGYMLLFGFNVLLIKLDNAFFF